MGIEGLMGAVVESGWATSAYERARYQWSSRDATASGRKLGAPKFLSADLAGG